MIVGSKQQARVKEKAQVMARTLVLLLTDMGNKEDIMVNFI